MSSRSPRRLGPCLRPPAISGRDTPGITSGVIFQTRSWSEVTKVNLFLRPRLWTGLAQGHREGVAGSGKGLRCPNSCSLALWGGTRGSGGAGGRGSWKPRCSPHGVCSDVWAARHWLGPLLRPSARGPGSLGRSPSRPGCWGCWGVELAGLLNWAFTSSQTPLEAESGYPGGKRALGMQSQANSLPA